MPSDIEQAEHVLNNLRQKRVAAGVRGHSLGEESTKLTFAAHTGDKAARQKLDKVNAEVALFESELRDSAIAEGTARVEAARQAEARAADRQRAEEALTLLHETGKCFEYLDRHLDEAVRALIAIDNGFAQLRQSGFVISDTADRIGITAIIQSWAHRIPRRWHEQLRDNFQFLAPGARRTATEHWTRMRASIDGQITQRLGAAERV
jgi:hypothetical protein